MILVSVLSKYPAMEDCLIEILLEFQSLKKEHYISQEEIAMISEHLHISKSKVCSVISFYSFFSTEPRGKYIIQVCKDVPCYVNDGVNVIKTLEQILGIKVGETTPNKMFTLEFASCLGCCDQPPSMRIDGKTYTRLNNNKVKAIISEYRGKQYD